MKTTLSVIGCITLICIGYAAIEIGWLAEQERTVDLASLQMSIQGSLTQFDTTLDNANGAITEVRDMAQKEEAAYDPKKPGSIPNQTYRLIEDTKTLIGHTDASLNGEGKGAIPALAETLRETGNLSAKAGVDLDVTAKTVSDTAISLRPGIDNLTRASAAAADDLADPSIPDGLKHADASIANVEVTTNDVKQVADAFRNDYLKPRNRLWLYFKMIIGLGAQAGDISKL